jgi:hypothetical protein
MSIRFERAGACNLATLLDLLRRMQEADPWEERPSRPTVHNRFGHSST